jgi:hypothetical protein
VRAGTITLRLDDLLVGIDVDTDEALDRCRSDFAPWIDDTQPDIPAAFDLRFGASGAPSTGVRAVPQLRAGASVVARSRSVDDVVDALDSILGGVRASRATPERVWTVLRPFVRGGHAVLVDARAPMLVNDPLLARAGIIEIPTWAVAVARADGGSGAVLDVPESLTGGSAARRCELVGVVTVGDAAEGGAGAVLARYGARHTSPTWFRTLGALLDDDRLVAAADRVAARHALEQLLPASR